MRVLFVSRAFSPVGGMEKHNADLAKFLGTEVSLSLIANRRGKRFLPIFYPWAILKTLFLLPKHDVLLLGDGVLALLGAVAKFFFPRKTVVSVLHGLDITFTSPLYQKFWVRGSFPYLDGFIAVSQATKEEAIRHGVDSSKVFILPNGLEMNQFRFDPDRSRLSSLLGFDTGQRIVLLTIGRLVKRKGVAWFIHEVLPKLPEHFHYAVAGAGPEEAAIREAITLSHMEKRVSFLGRVSTEDKDTLIANSDIFVQPNIPVVGDMEGFGIAVIEASAAGLPVVASRLEGLQDAIADGENGLLVTPEKPEEFVRALQSLENRDAQHSLSERGKHFTREHFEWSLLAKRYVSLLEDFRKSTLDSH